MPDAFRRIIIPRFDVEEETVAAVLSKLETLSEEHDPDKVGVRIVVRSPRESGEHTITMNMHNTPVGDLVCYICLGAGLKLSIVKGIAIVESRETAPTR